MFDKLKFWKKEEIVPPPDATAPNPQFDDKLGLDPLTSNDPLQSMSDQSMFNQSMSNQSMSSQPMMNDSLQGMPGVSDQFGSPNMDFNSHTGLGSSSHFQEQQFHANQPYTTNQDNAVNQRDVELILSRLDLIKTQLENVNHRLNALEAQIGNQKRGW